MLIDAGPLISLTDGRDPAHSFCKATLSKIRPPLITTWPAITEAMHLVGRRGGWHAQQRLWQLIEAETITIADVPKSEIKGLTSLMKRYRDAPMDLADATLVAVAEQTNDTQIFTLDEHFHIYRLSRTRRFTVFPA